jgi:CBS domain-containing protein
MIKDFRTFPPEANLAEPAELLGHGWQHSFPVVQNGCVLGVLTRSEILVGLSEFGPSGLIGSVMKRNFMAADAAANADQVLTKCRGGDDEIIPVIEQGQLIGLLSPAHIPDALAVRALLN